MTPSATARRRMLERAFDRDGFDIADCGRFTHNGRIGLIAEHRTARNYDTGQRKRAYYVEGTPYEMGHLIGQMAEPEIDRMTSQYIDEMVRQLIHGASYEHAPNDDREAPARLNEGLPLIPMHAPLVNTVYRRMKLRGLLDAVPVRYHEELAGIVDGCRAAAELRKRRTSVCMKELWVLNAGIDYLFAIVHSGKLLDVVFPGVKRSQLRAPMWCNGFALLGDATTDGALMGRDFMFPTGDAFQDLAALIIRHPAAGASTALPTVSLAAPGIVGAMAAMNSDGVAAGVDVTPGANSDPTRPGLNSLLLVRHSIETGPTAEEAVDRIAEADRGVSWGYLVADGGHAHDRACVVETGAVGARIPSVSYIGGLRRTDPKLHRLLPTRKFLLDHPTGEVRNGAMVRWDDGVENLDVYLETFNEKLWQHFKKQLRPGAFAPDGYINEVPPIQGDGCPDPIHEQNCPQSYYFAPQRGVPGEVLVVTNHFIHPEMRLCAMKPWTNSLNGPRAVDTSQWRYDELNHRILAALDDGPISPARAKALIDFLSPKRDFRCYYWDKNPRSRDGKSLSVNGAVLLFDLKRRSVEASYGYHDDKWVKVRLSRYV